MSPILVSIVEDHVMIGKALSNLINQNERFSVLQTMQNGLDFIEYVQEQEPLPEIALMDINMPFKNGIETTQWLTENQPEIKVIALTMEDDEESIIKMLKAGAKGYLLKDMHPKILFEAMETVYSKGIFYTDIIAQSLHTIQRLEEDKNNIKEMLKERELEFIHWACSELTYKEIAEKMFLSPKTIDNYRDAVFVKLNVKSRVGLVLFAIKHQLYEEK